LLAFNTLKYCIEALSAPSDQVPQYLEAFKEGIKEVPKVFPNKPAITYRMTMLIETALAIVNLRTGNTSEAMRVRIYSIWPPHLSS
jgi:hypothetical protein